jgi:hypothetical protein
VNSQNEVATRRPATAGDVSGSSPILVGGQGYSTSECRQTSTRVVLGEAGAGRGHDVADALDVAGHLGDVASAAVLEVDHEQPVTPPPRGPGVDREHDAGEAVAPAVVAGVETVFDTITTPPRNGGSRPFS